MRFLGTGLYYSQGQTEEAFHPNYYGQRALGNCLERLHKKVTDSDRPQEWACENTPGKDFTHMRLKAVPGPMSPTNTPPDTTLSPVPSGTADNGRIGENHD
ncbi:hypothetical protein NCG97_01985 [Streptomyces lydicamycinicus]|uniref:hypothetical protein n=1 Tax=Streptomyces lydicamycinicus TaxID=1546107 RepID=UPI0020365437|nr:hypothetical protein [Streptomyces lydicamycinicus]URZ99724.1 hypothetical protein NCG97_01985 [Streptomyces lydicamycinicus]